MFVLGGGRVGTGSPAGPTYQVPRSLRLGAAGPSFIKRTFGVPTSSITFTLSMWVKLGFAGTPYLFATSGTGNSFNITSGLLALINGVANSTPFSPLDPAAWYHFVFSVNGLALTISSNGVVISTTTLSGNSTTFNTNGTVHYFGSSGAGGVGYDHNIADVYFVDGQELPATAFGKMDLAWNSWTAKAYTGTYGNNGFYLPFNNTSSVTTLCADASGNGNHFTPNNLTLVSGATYASSYDVPSGAGSTVGNGLGNYAVLNRLSPTRSTLSVNNLTASGATDTPTLQPASGNWYFEISGVAKNWTPPAAFPAAAGDYNFGQRPFTNSITSGYQLLRTDNLTTPAVIDSSKYFGVSLYTGNGTTQTIANSGAFAPDFVWLKRRSGVSSHKLADSTRTSTKALTTDTTGAETTDTVGVTSISTNGFSVGADAAYNTSTVPYVAWQWKKSTIAGFDIQAYIGNGSSQNVAHALGAAPNLIIVKRRDAISAWAVYHSSLANTEYMLLNTTAAKVTSATTYWNSTTPTSSVFSVGSAADTNSNAGTYIAYLFASVYGFSSFGAYTGNGSSGGPFIYCGFAPNYVLIKATGAVDGWYIYDKARTTIGSLNNYILANSINSEISAVNIGFYSNGFSIKSATSTNTSGGAYVYAAFAENPFKYALAR